MVLSVWHLEEPLLVAFGGVGSASHQFQSSHSKAWTALWAVFVAFLVLLLFSWMIYDKSIFLLQKWS